MVFRFNSILLAFLAVTLSFSAQAENGYRVTIDLQNVQDDRIKVKIDLPEITQESVEYKMPYIVPGVYAMDKYGKQIKGFVAFDKDGNEIKSKRIKKNAWRIKNATGLASIEYWVGDVFDKGFNFIFRAGGTNIEADKNFLINHTGFYGYLDGHKNLPYELVVIKPESLYGATAMHEVERTAKQDRFSAPNYVVMADQPIMYCKPDTASHWVGNTHVKIAVYSSNGIVKADTLNEVLQPLTVATEKFLGELPVKEYQYLFYFTDDNSFPNNLLKGALEHSQSSVYVLSESNNFGWIKQATRSIAAHEFLHILTPLNLHSEHIANYNFHDPVMSQHLWLYEGVTEYFSMLVEVQQNLITEYEFRNRIRHKMNNAAEFKPYSLTEMSTDIIYGKGLIKKARNAKLYGDIYEKGALVAFLLDVRLNKLTNGEKDLLSVVQQLMKTYGKDKPFDDATFIDAFVAASHPEMRQFFDDYVIGKKPLPYKEYYSALGWEFHEKGEKYEAWAIGTQFAYNTNTEEYSIHKAGKSTFNFEEDDIILKVNGSADVRAEHLMNLLYSADELASVTIKRNGVEMYLKANALEKQSGKLKSVALLINYDAAEEAKAFRKSVIGQ